MGKNVRKMQTASDASKNGTCCPMSETNDLATFAASTSVDNGSTAGMTATAFRLRVVGLMMRHHEAQNLVLSAVDEITAPRRRLNMEMAKAEE